MLKYAHTRRLTTWPDVILNPYNLQPAAGDVMNIKPSWCILCCGKTPTRKAGSDLIWKALPETGTSPFSTFNKVEPTTSFG